VIPFPIAFGLTLLVEGVVLWLLFRRHRGLWRIGAAAILGNVLTHPVVFLVLPRWMSDPATYIIIAESFAFSAEIPVIWAVLRPDPWRRSISASALANGASYLLGLILCWLIAGSLPGF
jgi:hypothetical protein